MNNEYRIPHTNNELCEAQDSNKIQNFKNFSTLKKIRWDMHKSHSQLRYSYVAVIAY